MILIGEERYRRLLDCASEGIYQLDSEGRCVYINQAALSLLGFTAQELLGQSLQSLHQPNLVPESEPVSQHPFIPEFPAEHSGLILAGARHSDELMWRKDGTAFPVDYYVYQAVAGDDQSGWIVVFRDLTEVRAATRQLSYLANRDPLTGLVNRYRFEQCLQQTIDRLRISRSDGTAETAAVCYIDLDQFKVVNDSCGHATGDQLLRQISALMREQCRQSDILGRLGGDEFGVLFDRCLVNDAERIVMQMQRAVNGFRFFCNGQTFKVGLSAGLVALSADADSVAAVLSQADEACYLAKQGGRNRVYTYRINNTERVARDSDRRWFKRIQHALSESSGEEHTDVNRLALSAQTVVPLAPSVDSSSTPGATGLHSEILVRMRDSGGDLIPPGAFLPAAERYDLMPLLDRWIVQQLLYWLEQDAVRSSPLLAAPALLTVNIASKSLTDSRLLDDIVAMVENHAAAAVIGFEINEADVAAHLAQVKTLIDTLKPLGCRFVLDKFGGGLSAFGYIKQLPIDFVKIDGQLIHNLEHDAIDRTLVGAINQVAHLAGLQTIATQVETPATLRVLRELGVDYAQGVTVAVPVPLEQLVLFQNDLSANVGDSA